MKWGWIVLIVLAMPGMTEAAQQPVEAKVRYGPDWNQPSFKEWDFPFYSVFTVQPHQDLDDVHITIRLYMGTLREIPPLLGKACGVHMATSRVKTEWMLSIQGEQGRELWLAHLKAGTPLVFTIGWPSFPLLGAATIEVRSQQGTSADRWERRGYNVPSKFDHPLMPKVTYQEFPLEEACPEIVMYPVKIEPSDQPDHF
ncbi:MAG: hypothetical protein OEZ57_06485 [Nitrospirota bacterium]|nr:hypothetical protein [Nitrospirota bacterium]MDH5774546.1 hypothetical protein [Nitrospirota bacterium]